MSLPTSNERRGPVHGLLACLGALSTLAGLAACSSTPVRSEPAAQPAAVAHAAPEPLRVSAEGAPAVAAPAGAAAPAGNDTGASGTPAPRPEVSDEARSDFTRAVSAMREGNATEAELGFKQMTLQYPQFAAPLVNLAILQRKDGHLDQAEDTLKQAVAHESGSAVAWTELGVTQRERGEFKDAQGSYERAVDPRYAPAWRNLGVLSDLYLGDPQQALKDFEQYKQLTGEDKPVSGWIAELRQRLGVAPAKHSAPAESAPPSPGASPPPADQGSPAEAPPEGTPPGSAPQGATAAGG
jgi:tetratricopeptide (TPR) repeat protein